MIDVLRAVRLAAAGTGVVLLAACGGGTTAEGAGGNGGGGAGGASYTQLIDRFDVLAEEADALDPTPVGSMPTVGTASYEGVGQIVAEAGALTATVAGEVELSADFASGTVDGRMFGFLGADDQALSGELQIGTTPITGNSFTFDMVGTVSGDGSSVALDLDGIGGFAGAGADYVAGDFSGSATSGATSGTATGVFVARRVPGTN